MKRINGIYQNCDPVDQPEGFYRHAKNIVINESEGAIVNESGTILQASLPANNQVIGSQLLENEDLVLFSVAPTNEQNEIGLFSNGVYTQLLQSNELNFSIEHPIQSDFYVNSLNERVVVWTDGFNKPRILNIDNPTIDFNYTSLFPHSENIPSIKVDSVNYGEGSLKDGVYYFAIAYIDNETNDVITDFINVTGPISVRPSWDNIGSSSVSLSINNVDTYYERIQIAVIKKTENIIDEVILLPIISSSVNKFIYSGDEGVTPGSLAEIQIDNAFYKLVQTLHINDNKLYMGNLEGKDEIRYQPYANDIKVHLVMEPVLGVEVSSSKDQKVNFSHKGFFKGETYAFYISFMLKEGGQTKAFHIPGRPSLESDLTNVVTQSTKANTSLTISGNPNAEVSGTNITISYDGKSVTITLDENDNTNALVAEGIESVVNASSLDLDVTRDDATLVFTEKTAGSFANGRNIILTVSNINQWSSHPFGGVSAIYLSNGSDAGSVEAYQYESIPDATYNMGYWENKDETYPNTDDWISASGTDLRNQKVRHHSIPDVKHLPGIYKYNNPVGIKLTNVVIPDDLRDIVCGYKVYYAKHDETNRKILDQGIIINSLLVHSDTSNSHENHTDETVYLPNPYNSSSLGAGFGTDSRTKYSHPFTLLRKRTNIDNLTHIQIIDETTTFASGEIEFSNPFSDSTTHAHKLAKLSHSLSNTRAYNSTDNFPLTGKAYIDASNMRNRVGLTQFGFLYNFNNYSGEAKLIVRTKDPLPVNKYFLVNFRTTKRNLYFPFDQQILADTGYIHTNMNNLNSGSIYGGDAFNAQTYVWKSNRTPKNKTIVAVHIIDQLQSYDNIFLRKYGKDQWETYFPKVDAEQLSAMYFKEDGSPVYVNPTEDNYATKYVDNWFGYDDADSSVNDIRFPGIYPKFTITGKEYPTRVIRSSHNFRIFRQDDFLDLIKKRGDLVKLTTYNNILIPHMQRALVRTRGQEELQVDEINAFLGTGDIFGVKPDEIIYTEDGFAGLLDKTHSMSTPYGYFFYDVYANRIYVLNHDGIKDISEGILPLMKEFDISEFFLASPTNLNYTIT